METPGNPYDSTSIRGNRTEEALVGPRAGDIGKDTPIQLGEELIPVQCEDIARVARAYTTVLDMDQDHESPHRHHPRMQGM